MQLWRPPSSMARLISLQRTWTDFAKPETHLQAFHWIAQTSISHPHLLGHHQIMSGPETGHLGRLKDSDPIHGITSLPSHLSTWPKSQVSLLHFG